MDGPCFLPLLFAEVMTPENGLIALVATILTALTSAIRYLYKEVSRLHKREDQCQRDLLSVRAELQMLQVVVEQMQWTGDLPIQAQVVVNVRTGCIESWNPAATALLIWPQREMMGRPLTKIIPERFREKHSEAIRRLLTTGSVPRVGPHTLTAIRKDGSEVDLTATYSGWHDVGGDYFVGAVLKRLTRQKPDSDSQPPMPSADPASS